VTARSFLAFYSVSPFFAAWRKIAARLATNSALDIEKILDLDLDLALAILQEIDQKEKIQFQTVRWLGTLQVNMAGKVARRTYRPEDLMRLPGDPDRIQELKKVYNKLKEWRTTLKRK
jgi:hypothetical protein